MIRGGISRGIGGAQPPTLRSARDVSQAIEALWRRVNGGQLVEASGDVNSKGQVSSSVGGGYKRIFMLMGA